MFSCNSSSISFNIGGAATLIGSQRDPFPAVAHCPAETFRGATVKEIPLTRGKVALVDDEDYEALSRYKWSAHSTPNSNTLYAGRGEGPRDNQRCVLMHRQILGEPPNDIDHKNGDGLDNQRHNLRNATHQQNCQNARAQVGRSSAYKGVFWDKQTSKWRATIMLNGRSRCLGRHTEEKDAALAYDHAARELFGEFARLNFPT